MTARTQLARARAAYRAGDFAECANALRTGLAAAPPGSQTEAHFRVLEVRLLLWERPALHEARRALELATASGAPAAEAHLALGTALYMEGKPAALRHLRRAVREARTGRMRAEAGQLLAAGLHMLGRLRDARKQYAALKANPATRRDAQLLAHARYGDAHVAMMVDADYEFAIAELRDLLHGPVGLSRDELRSTLAIALADHGEYAEATAVLDMNAAQPETAWGRSELLYARAEVEWAAGRLDRAIAVAEECAAVSGVHHRHLSLVARSWARFELGLHPDPPPDPQLGPLLAGSVDEARGLVAFAERRPREALSALLAAAEQWSRIWVRGELRALWGAARAADRAGDAGTARDLRETVRVRAEAAGLRVILARLDPPATVEHPSLSERQLDVMRLVAAGLPSTMIAERLGLSTPTVETHVRAAIAKLGARTRIEAAAAATVLASGGVASALAPEDRRVVDLLASGATVSEAAGLLHVSRRTLTRRLELIRRHAAVDSNAELVARFRR